MIHAELASIGAGVHALIAKPDRGAVANAAVIDVGDETLVVDTFVSFSAARELRAAAEQLTGRPATRAVNTHWHLDHVLGNGEFTDATIVSTTRTRELVATRAAARLAEHVASFEELAPPELERLRAAGDEEGASLLEEHVRELEYLELRLPDETFDERWRAGRAEALTFGGGHTESDAVVLVADAGVLVAGDLIVVGGQPWAGDGDPAAWAEYLERLLELDWQTCVPGHGPVSGREVVEPLRDYLLVLDEAVHGSAPEPELPERFGGWQQPEMWARNLSALRAGS